MTRDALIVFCTKIIGAGSALLLNVVIARILRADGAGIFFMCMSVVTIAYALARMGFGYTTYRYIAEANETGRSHEVRSIAEFSIGYVFKASIVVCLGVIIGAPYLSNTVLSAEEMVLPLSLMALTVPIYCVGGMYSEVLKGLRKPLPYSVFESVLIKVFAIPLLLFLGLSHGLLGAASAFVIANIIALAFVWYVGRSTINAISAMSGNVATPYANKRGMLKSTVYFAVVSYSTVAAQWCSPLIVGATLDTSSAAVFFASYRTATILEFVLLSLAAVLGPIFVRAYADGGYTSLMRAAKKHAIRAAGTSVGLGAALFAVAQPLMRLYGEDFIAGVSPLRIMIVLQLITAPLGVFGLAVSAARGERVMAVITPISCLVGLIAVYIGAATWQLNGAAAGVGLANIVTNVLLFIWFFRNSRMQQAEGESK